MPWAAWGREWLRKGEFLTPLLDIVSRSSVASWFKVWSLDHSSDISVYFLETEKRGFTPDPLYQSLQINRAQVICMHIAIWEALFTWLKGKSWDSKSIRNVQEAAFGAAIRWKAQRVTEACGEVPHGTAPYSMRLWSRRGLLPISPLGMGSSVHFLIVSLKLLHFDRVQLIWVVVVVVCACWRHI